MLTKSDIQNIKQLFETAFSDKFEDARRLLADDILTFKDEIVGELQAMRDEVAIVNGYKDQIGDYEVRLEKVEKTLRLDG